nr:MAG TPA: hypothetical protein [Caudoviricetes sp.]
MNRKERRKLGKKGVKVKAEPVLMMKPSEIGKAAALGVGKEAMMHEIDQQILRKDKEYQLDMDTMVLWSLNQFAGWGPKKLRAFYYFMFKEHLRMREFYEVDDLYPERYKLKEKGVDLEEWYKDLFDEESNFRTPGDAFDEPTDKKS